MVCKLQPQKPATAVRKPEGPERPEARARLQGSDAVHCGSERTGEAGPGARGGSGVRRREDPGRARSLRERPCGGEVPD